MNLQSQQELDSTREKLRLLERRYDVIRREAGGSDRSTGLTLQSLRALTNQLKEEIARFEGRIASHDRWN